MLKNAQTCSNVLKRAQKSTFLHVFCTFYTFLHVFGLFGARCAIERDIANFVPVVTVRLSAISRTKKDVHLLRTLMCPVRDIANFERDIANFERDIANFAPLSHSTRARYRAQKKMYISWCLCAPLERDIADKKRCTKDVHHVGEKRCTSLHNTPFW